MEHKPTWAYMGVPAKTVSSYTDTVGCGARHRAGRSVHVPQARARNTNPSGRHDEYVPRYRLWPPSSLSLWPTGRPGPACLNSCASIFGARADVENDSPDVARCPPFVPLFSRVGGPRCGAKILLSGLCTFSRRQLAGLDPGERFLRRAPASRRRGSRRPWRRRLLSTLSHGAEGTLYVHRPPLHKTPMCSSTPVPRLRDAGPQLHFHFVLFGFCCSSH